MIKKTLSMALLAILLTLTIHPGLASADQRVRIIIELEDASLLQEESDGKSLQSKGSRGQFQQTKEKLVSRQTDVKEAISTQQIDIDYVYDFVHILNGFSASVDASSLDKIRSIPGVKEARIAQTFRVPPLQPNMVSSKDLVRARETWGLDYQGQGKVVAIVDTTLDPSHPDMRISEGMQQKHTLERIKEIALNNKLSGIWHNDKVPYGYNYADKDNVLDNQNVHGMHVAGIVAANTSDATEKTGIKGVAPEAQLLAMKIGSSDVTDHFLYEDVILRAVEDSITLEADVINLSLGSSAAFVQLDSPFYKTLQLAIEGGIVPVIASGNEAYLGANYRHPYAQNPDIGTTGSPGSFPGTLSVASVDNTIPYKTLIHNGKNIAYWSDASGEDPKSLAGLGYLDCGEGIVRGDRDDFPGKTLSGKIALIKRGSIDFSDKITNAQNAGASGAIIYNHESGGNIPMSMSYDTDNTTIPVVSIGNLNGKALLKTKGPISFSDDEVLLSGEMSSFTSWGVTPSLEFKPDITAPGGNIYSTVLNHGYATYSGTSMACPHAAGGAALVLERMEKHANLKNLSGSAKVNMVKNLMMSTARPAQHENGVDVSVRRQGAGIMDLYAATTTSSYVVDKATGLSKVNLKEIGDEASFTLQVKNFGTTTVTYEVYGSVGTSYAYTEDGLTYIDPSNASQVLDQDGQPLPLVFSDSSISVIPGETKDIQVSLDLSQAVCNLEGKGQKYRLEEIFSNGTFIEGFVRLVSSDVSLIPLSIPYMGFYGQWDQAPIFDESVYAEDSIPYYATFHEDELRGTYLTSEDAILGIRGDQMKGEDIAISPNDDGIKDTAYAVLDLLRNARETKVRVLDEEGFELQQLDTRDFQLKSYDLTQTSPFVSRAWNGSSGGRVVADGNYTFEIASRIDYENANWQSLRFPIRVDTVAPFIESVTYDPGTHTITSVASDGDFIGIEHLLCTENETVLASSYDGLFNLNDLQDLPTSVRVMVEDAAGNRRLSEPLSIGEDTAKPQVYLQSPEIRAFYNQSEIRLQGHIIEKDRLSSFTVNNQEVPLIYDAEQDWHAFDTTFFFEDGAQVLEVKATDVAGNTQRFERTFFVDTQAPQIQVTTRPATSVSLDAESVQLAATITDNMGGLEVFLQDDLLFSKKIIPKHVSEVLTPALYEIPMQTIPLDKKDTLITLAAIDQAGNVQIQEFLVRRPASGGGSSGGGGGGGGTTTPPPTEEINPPTVSILRPGQRQTLTSEGISLNIPANAVSEEVRIEIKRLASSVTLPERERILSDVYEFSKDTSKDFLIPVTMTMAFQPEGLDQATIPVLCWFDEKSKEWVEVPDCDVNWDTNTITGSVHHFTKFAVLTTKAPEKTYILFDIENHWAKESIEKMVQQNIILGYEDHRFLPDKNISRAEFCTMLIKTLGLELSPVEKTSMKDIQGHWAAAYVQTAYQNNIVQGYDETRFGPDDSITREQMTVMLGKALKLPATTEQISFEDKSEISGWAISFVDSAVQAGLLTGYPDGSFQPKSPATRAEAATLLLRADTLHKQLR